MGESGVHDVRAREPRGDPPAPESPSLSTPAPRETRPEPPAPEERGGSGREPVSTRPTDPVKRAADVLFALAGLLLTAPAWLVLPVLIRLEDGGPVLYAQERVGKGGERFRSWKFRSMRPRREEEGPLSQAGQEADRITRVGAFMRPRALDEIPQLWNILRGDMSLVGPRALLPEEIEGRTEDDEPVRLEELPGYGERHSVRPGLTGLAQTHAARDRPHRQKFHYDILYVRNRGLWLDVKLVVRSVGISLLGGWPEIESDESGGVSSSLREAESPA